MPTQILQPILFIDDRKGQVVGFVGELTSANEFKNTLGDIKVFVELLGWGRVKETDVDAGVKVFTPHPQPRNLNPRPQTLNHRP